MKTYDQRSEIENAKAILTMLKNYWKDMAKKMKRSYNCEFTGQFHVETARFRNDPTVGCGMAAGWERKIERRKLASA